MGHRRAAARLLVLALVLTSFVVLTWSREAANPAQATVGAPSWWSGDCDATYWNYKAKSLGWTGRGAYRLGASYLGVPACGPRPSVDGSPNVVWRRSGWGEYEWQCVELAQRFMAQIYGVSAYQANGNQVVSNYRSTNGGGLVRVNNGVVSKAPEPGDVISFNSSTNSNGHVSVVTSATVDGAGNGTVMTMEENYSANGWRGLTVKGWRVQPSGNLTPYGWLHDPLQRGNPNAFLPTSENLLTNSSFELGAASGWVDGTLPDQVTRTSVTPADLPAREGTKVLRVVATQAGASVQQAVGARPGVGRSYTFSAWVRSTKGPVTGHLVLSAIGGTTETGTTAFTAGDKWTVVSAPLSIGLAGHTSLLAAISLAVPGTVDVDGTQLTDAGLVNASLESGKTGWTPLAQAASVLTGIGTSSTFAHEGSGYLGVATKTAGGSVAQTVTGVPRAGHTYTFSAWLRTLPNSPPVSGTLRLSALGGTAETGSQAFTVGPKWTLVSAPLAVTRIGHGSVRAEVALTTTGYTLDIDATQRVDTTLANASFELGSVSGLLPASAAGSITSGVLTNSAFALEGQRYLFFRTSTPGASMRQTAAVAPLPGHSYVFSAWVRSSSGVRVSGRIALSTAGGTLEGGQTNFLVGPKWTHVSAALSLTGSGHTALLPTISLYTTGSNLYVDSTSMVAGDARAADTTSPDLTIATKPPAVARTTAARFTFSSSDPDDSTPSLFFTCVVDGSARPCGADTTFTVGQGQHVLRVFASDAVGNSSAPATFSWKVDSLAPVVGLTAPGAPFTLASTTKVTWTGSDPGSGVASYDVRLASAPWNGVFGAWAAPPSWQAIAGTSLNVSGLAPGRDYCFEVRARDTLGNLSAWTAPRCVARALDDRAFPVAAGWVRMTSSPYYFGTVTGTSRAGVSLTRSAAQLDRVALVVTKCPTCGTVAVYVGGVLVGKVNLYAATTTRQVLVGLPVFSLRTGSVVVTSLVAGKAVQVDGIGISRT